MNRPRGGSAAPAGVFFFPRAQEGPEPDCVAPVKSNYRPRHGCAVAAPAARLAALALAGLLLLAACAPDPVGRLKSLRVQAAPDRPLSAVLESFRPFQRVVWSRYFGPGGVATARASGILDLDQLVGLSTSERTFSPRDREALARARANVSFALEYAFPKDRPEGVRARMEMMIATMDWSQSGPLADEAILMEIARGQPGPALAKALIDAADYCRAREPAAPGKKRS